MPGKFDLQLLQKPEIDSFERYSRKFAISSGDENWFRTTSTAPKLFPKGSRVARQGREDSNVHLLISGWAYTAADHGDGTRTVFDLHLPGDIIISPGILTAPRRTTLLALSDCEIAPLNVTELLHCSRNSVSASNFVFYLLGHQLNVLADRVVQTTRMPAITRISLFYLSLLKRMREIAPGTTDRFFSPVTQGLLGEILGMSEVHVSRTMINLRSLDALAVTNRIVEYRDIEKLEQLSRMPSDTELNA